MGRELKRFIVRDEYTDTHGGDWSRYLGLRQLSQKLGGYVDKEGAVPVVVVVMHEQSMIMCNRLWRMKSDATHAGHLDTSEWMYTNYIINMKLCYKKNV